MVPLRDPSFWLAMSFWVDGADRLLLADVCCSGAAG